MFDLALILHLICCAYMVGLIWTVQGVHYPSFLWVDKHRFAQFERFHQSRMTFVVAPVMFLEFATAVFLVVAKPGQILLWTNLIGVLLLWLVTLLVSVPLHRRLARAWDEVYIRRLIHTNWMRTVIWTARLLIFVGCLPSLESIGRGGISPPPYLPSSKSESDF